MPGLVLTELLKLRVTRSTWGLLLAALVLAALRTAGVLLSVGTAAGVRRGSAEATLTLAGAPVVGVLVLLVLAITSVTSEFRHGTLTGSVLLVPDRRRLVVAKCVTLSLVGIGAGMALLAVGLTVALATGIGGAISARDALVLLAGVVVVGAFWTWMGVGIGLLVNNQTIAVLVPFVWLVVVEPLVGSSGLTALVRWLPGSLPGQVLPESPGGPGPVLAVVLLVVYGLALSVPGAVRLRRRDLT